MNRSKRAFISLAALLAGTYLVLAVFSVVCAIDHAEPASSHDHHGSSVSHSSFCAWACQANPTCNVGPFALLLHPFLVATHMIECSHTAVAGGGVYHSASRAPPVQS
jgi:hypothetical protein